MEADDRRAPSASTTSAAPARAGKARRSPAPPPPTTGATRPAAQRPRRRAAPQGVRTLTARRGEPVAGAAHRLDQAVLPERLERERAGGGCARRRCAPRCRRGRPTPGRAAARASGRAPAARGRSAAAGTPWARGAPARPSTVTRCVGGIEPQRSRLQRLLRRLRRAPAQHRLDARLQLARRERLGDVVVDPGLEARDLVRLVGARGHHDDRQLARARVARAAACANASPDCPGSIQSSSTRSGSDVRDAAPAPSRRPAPHCTS